MIAHLAQQAEMLQVADAERAEVRAEWEAEREAKAALDRQVRFEALRGCGLRNPSLDGGRSPFREGDIVYHPPPPDRSTQPGVAVVFRVCRTSESVRTYGTPAGRRWPTGELNLLWWDLHGLKFRQLQHNVRDRDLTLFPPCCGRGAACNHLLLANEPDRWQWPNGDALDLRVLRPIPKAFSGLLNNELREGGWQQRRALQETFKTLLGPHYKPVAAASSSAADKSEHACEHMSEHGDEHMSEHGDGHAPEHDSSDSEVSVHDAPPDVLWDDSD